jgi:hypothetical protein
VLLLLNVLLGCSFHAGPRHGSLLHLLLLTILLLLLLMWLGHEPLLPLLHLLLLLLLLLLREKSSALTGVGSGGGRSAAATAPHPLQSITSATAAVAPCKQHPICCCWLLLWLGGWEHLGRGS